MVGEEKNPSGSFAATEIRVSNRQNILEEPTVMEEVERI